ncbi:MAG TPA: peptidylprolyl isomerase [Planctomycetota bacterium]|jgi:cyclophilin family peptidyl-prolyl cis-trans isomerase
MRKSAVLFSTLVLFAGIGARAAEAEPTLQQWVAQLQDAAAEKRMVAEQTIADLCAMSVRKNVEEARKLLEPLAKNDNKDIAAAAQRLLDNPALSLDLPRVRITLARGQIDLVLYEDDAPNTVANFVELTEKKFYDGLTFHRVIEKFMAQGGDPKGDGSGGPGYSFADESCAEAYGFDKLLLTDFAKKFNAPPPPPNMAEWSVKKLYEAQGIKFVPNLKSHRVTRASLAMANAGPDTNGSQFFICHVDCPHLDAKHTVFGTAIRGMNLVDTMKVGEKIEKIEVLWKRDHEYHVKKK